MVIQQQHSLLFQASWGSLKMKPKKKDKRNTKKRHKTEGEEGVNRNRNKGHGSGTLIVYVLFLELGVYFWCPWFWMYLIHSHITHSERFCSVFLSYFMDLCLQQYIVLYKTINRRYACRLMCTCCLSLHFQLEDYISRIKHGPKRRRENMSLYIITTSQGLRRR